MRTFDTDILACSQCISQAMRGQEGVALRGERVEGSVAEGSGVQRSGAEWSGDGEGGGREVRCVGRGGDGWDWDMQ